MAWVKQKGVREWREGVPYTGAIVHGYAWNCPEEETCPQRMEIHAFFLVLAKYDNRPVKGKGVEIFSCGYWERRKHICELGLEILEKRRNEE